MSPASNEEPGQPLPRRLRSLRVPMLIAAFALVAAWALLQGQAKGLESMAPAGCTSGGPAVIQGGPGMATDSDVVEIVTGWHAFTRGTHGDVIERMSPDCISVAATPSSTERVLEIRNADTTARVWMITDMIFFAPAYGVLLLLVLEWVRRLPDPTIRPATARARVRPEDPVLRAAIWLAGKKRTMTLLVVAGVACDWTENALMLHRLSSWWNVLDETGQLHTDDLGIALLRRFGIVKWAFLLLPIVVALVLAMRQVIRAAILLGRALPRVWVQIVLVAVFSIGVLMPDQGADALRRLSLWQWVPTLCLLALFVVVVVLTAGEALKPLAPVVVPVRPASVDPLPTTASLPTEPGAPQVPPGAPLG